MNRILIFGDSIAYGKWDEEGGWVARLRKYIDQTYNIGKDASVLVFNMGIPGDLILSTEKRFENELLARIKPDEKNLVVFSVGINDTCENNRTTGKVTPPGDFKNAYVRMIQTAKKHDCSLAVIGLFPVNPERSKGLKFSRDLAVEYEDYVTEVAGMESVPKLSLMSELQSKNFEGLLVDSVHPNAAGHEILYQRILAFLQDKKLL